MNEIKVKDAVGDALHTLNGAEVLLNALADSEYVHGGACDALGAVADMLDRARQTLCALE